MRVQSINNYAVTRNQSNNNQSKMPNQQSFGTLIIDKRGMEHMSPSLLDLVTAVFGRIERVFGESGELAELAKQTERDVLVHPFQDQTGLGGIAVRYPYKSDSEVRYAGNYYWDHELAPSLELADMLEIKPKPITKGEIAQGIYDHFKEMEIVRSIKCLLSPAERWDTTVFPEAAKTGKDAVLDLTKPLSEDALQRRFSTNLTIKIPDKATHSQQV